MPNQYVKYLEEYIDTVEDDCLYVPGSEIGIEIDEGAGIVSNT